eukprot:1488306-Pyramimonas_sp.AAC.2
MIGHDRRGHDKIGQGRTGYDNCGVGGKLVRGQDRTIAGSAASWSEGRMGHLRGRRQAGPRAG